MVLERDVVLVRTGTMHGALRPYLRLYTAAGVLVCDAGVDYSGTAEITACALPHGGSYTLMVSDDARGRTGTYGLLVQSLIQPVGAQALDIGWTRTATIAVGGMVDTYTVAARSDDTLLLRARTQTGALTPHIRVFTQQGALLCAAGTSYSNVAEGTCVVPHDAPVRVVVSDVGGSRTGDYALFVQHTTAPVHLQSIYVPIGRR